MTKRQAEIFRLMIVEGMTNEEISQRLGIATSTIKTVIRDYMAGSLAGRGGGLRDLLSELCSTGFLTWTLDTTPQEAVRYIHQPITNRSELMSGSVQFSPSKRQKVIFDHIKDSPKSLVIKAGPGTGKTTTIVHGASLISPTETALFLAFNKSIVEELKTRLPSNVPAATFHSFCFRAWAFTQPGRINVDGNKSREIWRNLVRHNFVTAEQDDAYGVAVIKLVGLAKGVGIPVLCPDDDATWLGLIDRFDIMWDSETATDEKGIELARLLLKASNAQRKTIDFNDMLYFPILDNTPLRRHDNVFVDEAQDTNMVQRALLARMVTRETGRVIAVGDENQAIYGFRGADSSSMQDIITDFDAEVLPLDISYRCSKAVVDRARQVYPTIYAASDAPEGLYSEQGSFDISSFNASDLICCRNSAPAIQLAYRCIANRIPVTVLGRDIGQGLVSLIKLMKLPGSTSVTTLIENLEDYSQRQQRVLLAQGHDARAQSLQDKLDSIRAMSGHAATSGALIAHIQSFFSDAPNGNLTLATIHKVKGLEYDRVFILDKYLMPSRFAKQPWQIEQENNLLFVGITRAKSDIVFIDSNLVK